MRRRVLLLRLFSALIFVFLLIAGLVGFSTFVKTRNQPETYHFIGYDAIKDTRFGGKVRLKNFPKGGMKLQHEGGSQLLVSRTGERNFECSGVCACDEDSRRSVSLVSKPVVFLVSAVSVVFAMNIARKGLEDMCISKYEDHCEGIVFAKDKDCDEKDGLKEWVGWRAKSPGEFDSSEDYCDHVELKDNWLRDEVGRQLFGEKKKRDKLTLDDFEDLDSFEYEYDWVDQEKELRKGESPQETLERLLEPERENEEIDNPMPTPKEVRKKRTTKKKVKQQKIAAEYEEGSTTGESVEEIDYAVFNCRGPCRPNLDFRSPQLRKLAVEKGCTSKGKAVEIVLHRDAPNEVLRNRAKQELKVKHLIPYCNRISKHHLWATKKDENGKIERVKYSPNLCQPGFDKDIICVQKMEQMTLFD